MSSSGAARRYLRLIDGWGGEQTGFKGKQRDSNGSYLQLVDSPHALTLFADGQSLAPSNILSRLAHGLPARVDVPAASCVQPVNV